MMTIMETLSAPAVQSTTSVTYAVIHSKDFTLENAGDYRILVDGDYTINDPTDRAFVEINLDIGTLTKEASFSPDVANDPGHFHFMLIVSLGAGAHNLSLKVKSRSGNTVFIRNVDLSVDSF